jgi:NitT/TauT family transport system substrate-binding protein
MTPHHRPGAPEIATLSGDNNTVEEIGRGARWGIQMNTLRFRVPPLIPVAVMVTIAAAGCSSQASTTSLSSLSGPKKTTIKVAALPSADLAGFYVAEDEGLFAKQGLRVTIETIASSQAVIAAQLAGRVDISAGSYIPYITAQAQGARFHILAEASILAPGTRLLLTSRGSHITGIADLVGKRVGVNGTNSIGTLLIGELLAEHGFAANKVEFITDQGGFPKMPSALQNGTWDAAFLAEPYVTLAEETYGEKVLADLDQGAALNFPIDGYVATHDWMRAHPSTAAAFEHAIQQGQAIAESNRTAVERAMAKSDSLPAGVTALMALPDFPLGPVDQTRIQREATAMLQFGMLGPESASAVRQGTLVKSMISS